MAKPSYPLLMQRRLLAGDPGRVQGRGGGDARGRASGFVMLVHLPEGHGALAVQQALVAKMLTLDTQLRLSLTWDQGREMVNHVAIAKATGLDIYFCDPHSPTQRGSNENNNGLLRQHSPRAPTCPSRADDGRGGG